VIVLSTLSGSATGAAGGVSGCIPVGEVFFAGDVAEDDVVECKMSVRVRSASTWHV
jgi:hypothetical protein